MSKRPAPIAVVIPARGGEQVRQHLAEPQSAVRCSPVAVATAMVSLQLAGVPMLWRGCGRQRFASTG